MAKDLQTFDQEIAAYIRASEKSGELSRTPGWGKPFSFDDGYDATPTELRMGYKILKNAGVVPLEVEMMNELNAMRARLDMLAPESIEAERLRKEIQALQLKVSMQLEALRP
ncbi:DnaJ family domain-containing protein [Chromobacterium vaccinii]|uniref:DnaJ family domain-containing protein n=1 Tax=Chromobacterium vaccinii TaxID=1108595 RepID=A0ABV0FGN7_9NEIS